MSRPSIEELIDQTVVVTQLDPGTDYSSFATFAVADAIGVATSFDGGTTGDTVDPALATPILDAIADELTARGYRRVGPTDDPELGVAVTAVVELRAEAPVYGGWWGAGAAASGFWGFPGAPLASGLGVVAPVFWRSGTLVIELYDLRAARATGVSPDELDAAAPAIRAVWAAFLHGASPIVDAAPVEPPIGAVQQAFAQSPYLVARAPAPQEIP